jgi:hypothetical protein
MFNQVHHCDVSTNFYNDHKIWNVFQEKNIDNKKYIYTTKSLSKTFFCALDWKFSITPIVVKIASPNSKNVKRYIFREQVILAHATMK